MNIEEYSNQLVGLIDGTSWECRWMGEHSPYLHLASSKEAPRLYLSAGIHGDEPAGPMAVLSMLEDASFFDELEVHLFPLLNPAGVAAETRENPEGVDLNRNFGPRGVEAPETARHIEILGSLPRVDIALCLHEDWEASGVYLYHVEPLKARFNSRAVLDAMGQHLPTETSHVIDGSNACEGVISKQESEYLSDEWPESIYLTRNKTSASFTLETPSSAVLEKRVAAQRAAVSEMIRQLRGRDSMN